MKIADYSYSAPDSISEFTFSDLVDIGDLQELIKHFSDLAGCTIAVLDVDSTIISSAGWQKICTCFNRIHPETSKNCLKSDSFIRQNLKTENPIAYKCQNGLWDVAYPIFIEGKHVATIIFGQFFFNDEAIDISWFANQAEKYAFDKTEYLSYLSQVPVISRKKAETLKQFSAILAKMLTKTAYFNLLLKKEKTEELRIANLLLNESEIKFRKLFEQAGVGLAQIESSTGRFVKINKKFADIIGYTIKEIMQYTFLDFTHPEDIAASQHYKSMLVHDKNTEFSIEKRYIRKDGAIIWVSLTSTSMWEVEEGNKFHISIIQDITEKKKNEEALKDKEIRAEYSKHTAEEAVKTKQQFLANMSHEIRTPMTAIIGFAKAILKTDLSPRQTEYILAIKTSGDSLLILINDILDLAKVDAGKMTFEQIPFRMALSLSAMLHLFDLKFKEKNLELVTMYDNNIPETLLGDPVRLNQIMLNLVSNAIKFTPNGKITVKVQLLKEDEEKASIQFMVMDTGIGIPENKISTIFENFEQASGSTARMFGGTGLGLAIVKKIVEKQGGNIKLESKLNKGSVFSFTLNFQKSKAEMESETGLTELKKEIKNIGILVVEDVALNQLLLKIILDDFGFTCEMAANGREAIGKLKNNSFDIILMDLQMPVMNGFEATEYIRTILNSKIPILALTADVTSDDLAKCKAFGMNDYIAKPIDEKLLYRKIVDIVKKTADPQGRDSSSYFTLPIEKTKETRN